MGLEMSYSGLVYAVRTASNKKERTAFLRIMEGDANQPSELYRGVMNMEAKYIAHLKADAGGRWHHEYLTHASVAWLSNAVFILAGLYAIYGRTLPRIRPGLVEKMEQDCDTPEKMYERQVLLGTFGDMSKGWAYDFVELVSNQSFPMYICGHGVAYIFVLAAAFIHAMEDTSDDALLSESEHLDIESHVMRLHPSLKRAFVDILEAKEF